MEKFEPGDHLNPGHLLDEPIQLCMLSVSMSVVAGGK